MNAPMTPTEERLFWCLWSHGGFATREQIVEAWAAGRWWSLADLVAAQSHLTNLRRKLPPELRLVSHKAHGYELRAGDRPSMVPPRPLLHLARCGHPSKSRIARQCDDCRARMFPCGHPRSDANSVPCSGRAGYRYARCRMCRYKLWRVRRRRLLGVAA